MSIIDRKMESFIIDKKEVVTFVILHTIEVDFNIYKTDYSLFIIVNLNEKSIGCKPLTSLEDEKFKVFSFFFFK